MDFFIQLQSYLPYLGKGLLLTIELTLISGILGFFAAIPLVVAVLYGNPFFKTLCKGIITLVRGTPLLVQLFFIYFGLPVIGIKLSPFLAAVIGFVLNSAAYQAEYMKGGFLAIPREQMEAGYSMGLSKWQVIRLVIFPQAFRFSIPSLSNELVYLVKYTSVAYIIQVPELFAQAKFFASDTYYFLQIFSLIGVVYLFLVYAITKLTDWLEKKLYIPGFEVAHLK